MSRRPRLKAAGKNNVWFAFFVIAAIVVVSLLANADKSKRPNGPAPCRPAP